MIPSTINILNNQLPDAPGVYFYFDNAGKILYVGKATSLKKRVGSYFTKAHNVRITELVSKIVRIDYEQTPTVLEALVLEANRIRILKPPYNIALRDDKSFLYLCITNEVFPKPQLLRGLDLERLGIKPFSKILPLAARRKFLAVYGPYVSGRSLRIALDLVRRSIPWSTCEPGQAKPCFDAQIGKCPGVCSGAISEQEYRKIIRQLMLFFAGKKEKIVKGIKREMDAAARSHEFERAAILRNKLFALEHIQDVSLVMREEEPLVDASVDQRSGYIDGNGRIEAYDIAHISGTSSVAAMVVFDDGKPRKSEYRKFRIKSFEGSDDVAALEEVIRRRLARNLRLPESWPLPEIFVIDGGEGQVNRVQEVLRELGVNVPVVGIAKGFDRKQDRLVYDRANAELRRVAESYKPTFQAARDEAHRFAGVYHRILRSRRSLGISPTKKKRI